MEINEKVLSLLEKMEENTRGMSEAVKEAEKSVSALEKSLTSAGDASQDAGNQLSEIGGTLSTISDVGGSVTDVIGSITGNALKSIPVIGNVLSVVGLVGSALSEIGSIMGETESQQQKLNDAIAESRKVYKEMMQDVAAEFNTQHTMLENTENLISKYQELRDVTDLSAGKQLDFYNVVDELAEHLPDATKLLWEQNDAYKVQLATLQDINEQRSLGIVSGYIEAAQQELSGLEEKA